MRFILTLSIPNVHTFSYFDIKFLFNFKKFFESRPLQMGFVIQSKNTLEIKQTQKCNIKLTVIGSPFGFERVLRSARVTQIVNIIDDFLHINLLIFEKRREYKPDSNWVSVTIN